jgi:SAM-dependent methyltransferase
MAVRRVEALYQRRAKLYQRFFIDFLRWEKVLNTFFATRIILRPGIKVLDAGCGTGSVTKVLYHLTREQQLEAIAFYGFDLTPAMLALFQEWIVQEGAEGIQLRQADVLELKNQIPRDWQDFDWIISSAMLEYVPKKHRDQALRNLKELLHHNGNMLLILTKRTRINKWTGAKWWRINLFDQDEIAADLQRATFSAIEFQPFPKPWGSFIMAVTARADSRTHA